MQNTRKRNEMSDTQNTPFSTKCEILSQLWMEFRNDENFADFIEYNDLGLPLAYAFANEIADPKNNAVDFINETFDVLLGALDVEDTGYNNLDELLGQAEQE